MELIVTLSIIPSIRNLVQLYVKDVEDEAVESWAESVTQTTNPCYHSLTHTCMWIHTNTHTHNVIGRTLLINFL